MMVLSIKCESIAMYKGAMYKGMQLDLVSRKVARGLYTGATFPTLQRTVSLPKTPLHSSLSNPRRERQKAIILPSVRMIS
jgi:hypothetical protein